MTSPPLSRGITIAIAGAALVATFSVAPARVGAQVKDVGSRQNAADFSLKDAKGAPVTLSRNRGKVVLLDFWATWCTGCNVEIPWYMEFQRKYKDKGLVSIGVAMDEEGWTAVRPYLRQHPVSYPTVLGDESFARKFGYADGLPLTLLIDRKGRIADTHAGMVDKDAWEAEIRQLLQEGSK